MAWILMVALSYVIGSIPSGLILGKLIWHIDLREHGSKNIGATNAWRTIGRIPGAIVFFFDFWKGAIGVILGYHLVGTPLAMVIGGAIAIVGHSCSAFLGGKGGKGVATGLGVIAQMMPLQAFLIFLLWFAIVYVSGYVSLASMVAAAAVPIVAFAFGMPTEYVFFGIVAAAFVIYRHRPNLERLLNGTESKIKAGHR